MRKTAIIVLMITFCASFARAQKETKNFSVGLGLEAGVPVGNYSNLYNFDAGLTVRFSFLAGPGFITLTTGAIVFAPKTEVGVPKKAGLQIPLRVGYKYIIGHHFFVMGEIGYVSTKTYYGSQGELLSVNSGSFIAAPSIGVQFNAFEISLRYDRNFKDQGGSIGPRIGFNF
jgi:hypothetical protein